MNSSTYVINRSQPVLREVGLITLVLGAMLSLRIFAAFHAGVEVDEPIYRFAASYFVAHGFPAVRPAYNEFLIPFLFHPPFAFMILGEWFRLWGNDHLITGRMFSIACSIVMLVILYIFLSRTISKKVAVVTLLLVGTDGWIIFTNQALYIENSQLILIILAVWTYWLACESNIAHSRKHLMLYMLAGLVIGFAIIWKHIAVFLLISVIANFALQRKHVRGHLLLLLMMFIVVGVYTYIMHSIFGQLYDVATITQIRRTFGARFSPGLNYSPLDALQVIYTKYWIFLISILVLIFGSLLTVVRFSQHVLGKRRGNTVILTWALGGIVFAVGTALKSPHYMILWLVPLYILLIIEGLPRVEHLLRGNKIAPLALMGLLLVINLGGFQLRFVNTFGDVLAQADVYIDTHIPRDTVIATQDYVGVDIAVKYVNIQRIDTLRKFLNSGASYAALYWSTTEPIPDTLGDINSYCIPLATFSGFKDHIEVCKLDRFVLAKLSGTSIPLERAKMHLGGSHNDPRKGCNNPSGNVCSKP